MPAYDYACPRCGPFTEQRPMAEYQEPQACPDCGEAAPRMLTRAPSFAAMDGALRVALATNERSAHAPRRSAGGHAHGPSCTHCAAPKMKSSPAKRPWMISH
jgi:putative FmdB family regulatory protein